MITKGCALVIVAFTDLLIMSRRPAPPGGIVISDTARKQNDGSNTSNVNRFRAWLPRCGASTFSNSNSLRCHLRFPCRGTPVAAIPESSTSAESADGGCATATKLQRTISRTTKTIG
eukprot:3979742-Pleurochrysis_carterae.AAC.1